MKFRAAAGVALSVMFVLLAWRLWQFLGISADALRFPFGLDYGEGIVWQQALLLFTPEAYGRIDGFPAIVFHYPPVYHAVTRTVVALAGTDMLYAGRAIAIGATLLTGLIIALIVARAAPADISRGARLLAAGGGGLAIFCLLPVVIWAPLMRVDMLAFLLSFVGFWMGLKAFERPGWIVAAALCFVVAVYTKQTAIIAPTALFALMFWLRPRLALTGIGTCVATGLAVLGALAWVTNGGFARHIFLYNINRVDWRQIEGIGVMLLFHGPFFGVALIMARRRLSETFAPLRGLKGVERSAAIAADRSMVAYLGILAYTLAAIPMLILIIKVGSHFNYLIEWLFTITLLVGTALFDAVRAASGEGQDRTPSARLALGVIFVPLAIAVQAWVLPVMELNFNNLRRMAELETLSARVRSAQKPVISDDMVMLLRSGKRVMWEPAIFAELGSLGVWNESAFVARIRRQEFAMFITVGRRGTGLFDSRYNPAVAGAIYEAYPVNENLAGFVLHLPGIASAPGTAETSR